MSATAAAAAPPELPYQLEDGLVMRPASRDDVERLVAFNGEIHRRPTDTEPNEWVAAWTRDLLTLPHPTVSAGDFLIVEDRGRIVSSLNLISQTWSYGGVEFGVGRPELVGTDPAYRRRGLVRREFDVIHRWSAARGELVQAITGIPWFYRQFGYEYALDEDGGRSMPRGDIPKLENGQPEPLHVRPATSEDVPFIVEIDRSSHARYLVAAVRDHALWQREVDSRGERYRSLVNIVAGPDGERVGYLIHRRRLWSGALITQALELRPGASWLAAVGPVLRYLAQFASQAPSEQPGEAFETLRFDLGIQHPFFLAAGERLARSIDPYGIYIRVPDVPAFIRRIAPFLERRLADSVASGYSGELRLSFYRGGLEIRFSNGRVRDVQAWSTTPSESASAHFPELTFLPLLFGRCSRQELEHMYPDCFAQGPEMRVLLDILFPKQVSRVIPIS